MMSYLESWDNLKEWIEEFINIDVNKSSLPFVQMLRKSKNNYLDGQIIIACAQASYVALLIEDLKKINKFNNEVFFDFIKRLIQDGTPESYFGTRMEIRIAGSLLEKGVVFEKTETPDFIIRNEKIIGIESTSLHLSFESTPNEKNLVYKIESAIRKKSKSDFKTSDVVLIIDISNLLFHESGFGKNDISEMDGIRPRLLKTINKSLFCSVITSAYIWESIEKGARLNNVYTRHDITNIDKKVKDFLDRNYPSGDEWVEGKVGRLI